MTSYTQLSGRALCCALWAALIPSAWAQAGAPPTYTIKTIAGGNFVGDGGLAATALLPQPEGIAIDFRGSIYVADATEHRIRKILPDGIITSIAGNGLPGFRGDGGPSEAATLNSPYGICLDRAGNLYIADFNNGRVRKIAVDGKISTVAGGGEVEPGPDGYGGPALDAKLRGPRNVAVDNQDNLYISDFSGHRVYRVAPNGIMTTVAGTGLAGVSSDLTPAAKAQISFPAGVAVDRQGTIYIADTGNKLIRKVQQGLVSVLVDRANGSIPPPLSAATGLALDAADNLYIADKEAGIFRVSATGVTSELKLTGGDIVIDAAGSWYVSTKGRLKKWIGGTIVNVAGSGFTGYAGDNGPAVAARFNSPAGIALSSTGSLYISDSINGRIRLLSSTGILTTVAGTSENRPTEGPIAIGVRLGLPGGSALDSKGNLIFADTSGNRIRKLAADGSLTTLAGAEAAGFSGDGGPAARAALNGPSGLTLDKSDAIYFADTNNSRIRKITPDGLIVTIAGGGAVEADGSATSTRLSQPYGVAIDSKGEVYFSEPAANRIRMLNQKGMLVTVADFRNTDLRQPRGIRILSHGDLLVADSGNHRIVQLSPGGQLTVLSGTGTKGFSGDGGPSDSAQLDTPSDVLADENGAILIADSGNHRVRKLVPDLRPTPVDPPPAPIILPIKAVHGATFKEQPVAPGQLITLFSEGIGPTIGATGKLTPAGTLETEVARTQVLFDGKPAPLFYVQDKQINVQVPYAVAGRRTTEVVVMCEGKEKGRALLDVAVSAPGLLTITSGAGQAVVVNEDGTINAPNNPAGRGSVVVLYATGDGNLGGEAVDGKPSAAGAIAAPVALTIGGYEVELLYAGRAPGLIGVMQINARLPGGFAQGGTLPVVLKINNQASQPGVTLAMY